MWSSVGASTYEGLVGMIVDMGSIVPSRYGDTYEAIGLQVRLAGGQMFHRKRINYGIGWMEALQLIAGTWDAERLRVVAPNADHSLFTDQMAYGPRVTLASREQPTASGSYLNEYLLQPAIDQFERVVATLVEDPNSRQAVAFIGRPWELCSSDLPCTLSMQFMVRNQTLKMIVTMRSWDLLKGFPYDVMMFSAVHQMMASILTNYATGALVISAGSTHVYQNDLEKMEPDHCCGSFYMPDLRSLKAFRQWATDQVNGDWVGKKGHFPSGIKVIDHDRIIKRKD